MCDIHLLNLCKCVCRLFALFLWQYLHCECSVCKGNECHNIYQNLTVMSVTCYVAVFVTLLCYHCPTLARLNKL